MATPKPLRERKHATWNLPGMHGLWTRHSLRALTADERQVLVDAQVVATRPIISGVIASGAVIMALTGAFEGVGLTPGIGYPWWVVELAAAAVGGCALAIWHISSWRPRLALTLLATVLMGVFMSISVPMPGPPPALAVRTGLVQLVAIALLALLARPVSVLAMVAVVVGLAVVRALLQGAPQAGPAKAPTHPARRSTRPRTARTVRSPRANR